MFEYFFVRMKGWKEKKSEKRGIKRKGMERELNSLVWMLKLVNEEKVQKIMFPLYNLK